MTTTWDRAEVLAEVLDWVRRAVGRDSVAPETSLRRLGLDSVKTAELLTMLEDRFGVEISVEDTYAGLSIAELTDRIVDNTSSVGCGTGGGAGCGIDFGLFFFASDATSNSAQRYRLLLDSAKFADDHGFGSIWVPERHFHSFGGLYPNPAVLGAALAATTQRVRIRAGSVVLPLHNPVRVAEDWSVVDNVSGGRVDVAFATGWNPDDFVLGPDNYRERVAVTRSGMATVQKLWCGESVPFPNGAGEDRAVRIYPAPLQPTLPFWLTCSGSIERFEMAGEIGANVLTALLFQSVDELAEKLACYRKARARAGHAGSGTVTVMLHTFIGESESFVRETVRGPFRNYLADSVDLWRRGMESLEGLDERSRAKVLDIAFERYYRTNGLFGTPDSALQLVGDLRAAGADEIAGLIDFGIAEPTVLRGLESLARLADRARAR